MSSLTLFCLIMSCSSTAASSKEVTITPNGPLYIAINTPTYINCSAVAAIEGWKATLKNGSTVMESIGILTPGVIIQDSESTRSSSIVVNTIDTSLISLECTATFVDMTGKRDPKSDVVNITIFGPPDPPENLSYIVLGNSVMTSWMSNTIEGVDLSYNLSLLFHEPSEIRSQEFKVSNVLSYNFTTIGLRSCDYFTFCVRGSNDAGLGYESCINGSLLYIPTPKYIDYSLSRAGENFSLTVTVEVPTTCLVNVQNSSYILEVIQGNDSRMSQYVPADSTSSLEVNNLLANRSYTFRIQVLSSNNNESSVLVKFFTSDVQGINICSTNDERVFSLSCIYANGSNLTGCGYRVTGRIVEEVFGTIMTDNMVLETFTDLMNYENITITDIDGAVLFEKSFNNKDVPSCSITTVSINSSIAATDNTGANNGISTAAIVLIILAPVLLLAVISIVVVICLCWHGYCCNPILQKVPSDKEAVKCNTRKSNGSAQDVTIFDNTQNAKVDTTETYSSLERLHTPHGANTVDKVPEPEYSQLKQEPLYHVLEKEPPLVSEDISADPDAPAIPPFCPSGGDTPPVAEVQQTTSTTADIMYAGIGNIRAKK